MSLSTNAKIGIGAAAALLIGIGLYFGLKKDVVKIDPKTGKPKADPKTGKPPVNPKTGKPVVDPVTGTTDSSVSSPPDSPEAESASPGESSGIQYIFQGGTGGDDAGSDHIGIKLLSGVNNVGDTVQIDHPNYKGQFVVDNVSDGGDGTSIIFVKTPFVTSGTNPEAGGTGGGNFAVDRQSGSVAVVGVPAASSANGMLNAAGFGTHWLTKREATTRKNQQSIGKGKGLKGGALRKFIRSNPLPPPVPVNPANVAKNIVNHPDGSRTITYGDGRVVNETAEQAAASTKKAVKGRGADGSTDSWAS